MYRHNKPNVILIVIDALRAKNLGCYGYYRNTSPNIDSLAKQGILFTNAFSTNNSTDPSFLSIHSGRQLLKKDSKTFLYNREEMKEFFESGGRFIQEILKERGYKTYCLNHLYSWQKIGFEYFFEENEQENSKQFIRNFPFLFRSLKNLFYFISSKYPFYYLTLKKIKRDIRKDKISDTTINKAIEVIKKERNPFFIRIDLDDTHMPYYSGIFNKKFNAEKSSDNLFDKISEKNATKRLISVARAFFKKDTEIEEVIAKYDNAIFYEDYLIGNLIEVLKKEDKFEDTIIIFLSDHGESLGQHNIYIDHFGLYDTTLNIPLIIKGVNLPKNKKINSLVQISDIVPTILDVLKLDYNPKDFDGKSLVPLINNKGKEVRDSIIIEEIFNLRRRGLRTKEYKYIETDEDKELYDLKKDPEELEDISNKKPELLIQMKNKLNEEIKNLKTLNEKRRINNTLSKL